MRRKIARAGHVWRRRRLTGDRISPSFVVAPELPCLMSVNTRICSRLLTIGALSLATLFASAQSLAQEAALTTERAVQQFDERVAGYVALRTQVTASVPRLQVLPDAARIFEQVHVLTASIRAARSFAQLGDLFTRDARLVFRIEIRNALADAHVDVEDLMEELEADVSPDSDPPPVVVNGPFPWAFGAAMPPLLLDRLPALPVEVQYRLIGRDLVLVDVDANLVVDILPDALPRGRLPDLSSC
jgi:hypothetical protein